MKSEISKYPYQQVEGYLTKKVVRAFLGGTHPVGTTTLSEWIAKEGFRNLSIHRPRLLWSKSWLLHGWKLVAGIELLTA
ncbi:MAG: hypothetical protein LUC43_06175 [Burkholderiales bacterium]|nr:hypothetical protein [Burkholderiales bacterium]